MCQLAEVLHKSLDEVMALSTAEIATWAAYFELKGNK
jgi:hypothetical protein